jgi:hypothetical protein
LHDVVDDGFTGRQKESSVAVEKIEEQHGGNALAAIRDTTCALQKLCAIRVIPD